MPFSLIEDEVSPSILLAIQCFVVPAMTGAVVIGMALLGASMGLARVVDAFGVAGGAILALATGVLMGWLSVLVWPRVIINGHLVWLASLALIGGLVIFEAGASASYYGGWWRSVSSYIANGGDELGMFFLGIFAFCGAAGYSLAILALRTMRRARIRR